MAELETNLESKMEAAEVGRETFVPVFTLIDIESSSPVPDVAVCKACN